MFPDISHTAYQTFNSDYLGHVQNRPDDHDWQFYFITAPVDLTALSLGFGEVMVGVCSTGEVIASDGRVYEGEAVTAETVTLPSFGRKGFNALKECIEYNDKILTELGWIPAESDPAKQLPTANIETMINSGSFLPTTYHYHGMMCPNTNPLSAGFHSCDLGRMCSKWAGSTSVASGGMGVQCGKEVAAQLDAAGLI